MAVYRKIETRIWADPRLRQLSKPKPNAQTLWLHLLSGPHTRQIPGLSCVGPKQLCEQLDWPTSGGMKAFYRAFNELVEEGMVQADWENRVVFVPEAIKFDQPTSPNIIKSWLRSLQEIPECHVKHAALVQIRNSLEARDCAPSGVKGPFVAAFDVVLDKAHSQTTTKPSPQPSRSQEQEIDHDHDQEERRGAGSEALNSLGELDILAQNEWHWLPIAPKWIARANALLPITAEEIRFAKAKVDEVIGKEGSGSNHLGLFIKIVEDNRKSRDKITRSPQQVSRGAQQIEAMMRGAINNQTAFGG